MKEACLDFECNVCMCVYFIGYFAYAFRIELEGKPTNIEYPLRIHEM